MSRVEHNFFLDIKPFPAERSACACRGRFPTVYTKPAYRAWLEEAIPKLKEIAQFEDFREVADRPVRISITVIRARPKTTKLPAPRGDNDNYEKGLWDAITKSQRWWKDDNQVVENTTIKRWAEPGEPEGYIVKLEFL